MGSRKVCTPKIMHQTLSHHPGWSIPSIQPSILAACWDAKHGSRSDRRSFTGKRAHPKWAHRVASLQTGSKCPLEQPSQASITFTVTASSPLGLPMAIRPLGGLQPTPPATPPSILATRGGMSPLEHPRYQPCTGFINPQAATTFASAPIPTIGDFVDRMTTSRGGGWKGGVKIVPRHDHLDTGRRPTQKSTSHSESWLSLSLVDLIRLRSYTSCTWSL